MSLVMHNENEIITALAHLPKGTRVTITVDADALAAAILTTNGGPEYGDAAEVARVLGFSATYWVRRAKRGLIDGAVQEGAHGRWRLPLESCRAHIRGLRRKPIPANARPTLVQEYRPRGPRKTLPQKTATSA